MNKLNVNPTRQELIKLKRRLKVAVHGHQLLKEKRDGLMKEFMAIIRQARDLRKDIEEQLGDGFKSFVFASSQMRPEEMKEALMLPAKKISLKAETKNVMSVNIPQFEYSEEGDFLSYGLASTAVELDLALEKFEAVLKNLIKLAEIEYSAKLLAAEIEKTRRRVNALEYVFIPNMKETIKYITSKLEEQERGALITLMKLKDVMEAQPS